MRGRSANLIFMLFVFSAVITCPYLRAQATQDVQAKAVLTKALAAAGGATAIAAIQDFSATGTISYYWGAEVVKGTVTVKARGPAQFRLDAILPSGTRTWAVSNGQGTLIELDGTRSKIPYYNAINFGLLSWRLPFIVKALTDSSASISQKGLTQTKGGTAYQIHIQNTDSSIPDAFVANLKSMDYFFDSTTYVLIKTVDSNYSTTNTVQAYEHALMYSDYRNVGVMIPFSITELINNQQTWTVQLDSINFNVGLSDTDFKL
jgi:outer membrane lipoprotein-sorting protein